MLVAYDVQTVFEYDEGKAVFSALPSFFCRKQRPEHRTNPHRAAVSSRPRWACPYMSPVNKRRVKT